MATLGNQTTGFDFTIAGSWGDVAGGIYTVPSPGIIVTQISAFCGNNGTGGNVRVYVWANNAGKPGSWLIRGSALPSLGALNWQRQSSFTVQGIAGSDGYLPAGTQIWIGYYASSGVSEFNGSGSGTAAELGNTADGNWSDHGPASGPGQLAAYIDYNLLPAPTLSSASPAIAPAGQTTTLTGTGLLHTSSITVCGVNAPTFTINSDTSITVTVPAGANTAGTIVVTTPAGTASTAFTAAGSAWVNTGTPASPVWVQGGVFVNIGTPASPNWVGVELDVNTGTPGSPIWTPGA